MNSTAERDDGRILDVYAKYCRTLGGKYTYTIYKGWQNQAVG